MRPQLDERIQRGILPNHWRTSGCPPHLDVCRCVSCCLSPSIHGLWRSIVQSMIASSMGKRDRSDWPLAFTSSLDSLNCKGRVYAGSCSTVTQRRSLIMPMHTPGVGAVAAEVSPNARRIPPHSTNHHPSGGGRTGEQRPAEHAISLTSDTTAGVAIDLGEEKGSATSTRPLRSGSPVCSNSMESVIWSFRSGESPWA